MTKPRTNSEHWKLTTLKIGQELVLLDRRAESVSGVVSRHFQPGQFTVKQSLLVFKSLDTRKAIIVKRIK